MEIGRRIKNLRAEHNISQEQLSEKIYVTRQTISSWENDKSYPDLNSLIRMSEVFNITIDNLVKGDIIKMKEIINQDDRKKFSRESTKFTLLIIVMVVSAPILLHFLDKIGIAIWAVIAIIGMYYAFKVEKLKKEYDISSLKEIEAFLQGEKLDEIEVKVEKAKSPYQTIILALLSAVLAVAIFIVVIKLLKYFNV